jgi:hypothetical protein
VEVRSAFRSPGAGLLVGFRGAIGGVCLNASVTRGGPTAAGSRRPPANSGPNSITRGALSRHRCREWTYGDKRDCVYKSPLTASAVGPRGD